MEVKLVFDSLTFLFIESVYINASNHFAVIWSQNSNFLTLFIPLDAIAILHTLKSE